MISPAARPGLGRPNPCGSPAAAQYSGLWFVGLRHWWRVFTLPETLPVERRAASRWGALADYADLLLLRRLLGYAGAAKVWRPRP